MILTRMKIGSIPKMPTNKSWEPARMWGVDHLWLVCWMSWMLKYSTDETLVIIKLSCDYFDDETL